MGKSERELKTAELEHTGVDSTDILWSLSAFRSEISHIIKYSEHPRKFSWLHLLQPAA